MLLTLTALRVIFRVIRVLFWETAWHTHWPGNHTWILPTKLNMFLLFLCLKTVFFFKDRGMKSWSPIFFSCIIAQKKPKIQTDCGKWSWRIIKKGLLMNWDVLSQFFFKRERAEAEKSRHGIDIRRNPFTWLNMLRPKGKTLHCFCDNDLWQTGKKSVWNTNITAGVVLVGYAAVLWFVTQHSLWGERVAWRNKERKCRRLGW